MRPKYGVKWQEQIAESLHTAFVLTQSNLIFNRRIQEMSLFVEFRGSFILDPVVMMIEYHPNKQMSPTTIFIFVLLFHHISIQCDRKFE